MKFVIEPSEGLEILGGNNQYFDGTGSALNSAEIGGGPTVPPGTAGSVAIRLEQVDRLYYKLP